MYLKPRIEISRENRRPHRDPKTGQRIPDVGETDRICEACQQMYIALTWKGKLWDTGLCITCGEKSFEKWKEHEKLGGKEKRSQTFKEKCPPIYQDFKKDLIPNEEVFEKVQHWNFGERGLLLVGQAGSGKTRSVWRLLQRLFVVESIGFEFVNDVRFGHKVSEFGKSETFRDWIQTLCKTSILFFDDLGKTPMTERVAAEFYYILEERVSHKKPVIVTMQDEPVNYGMKISARNGQSMTDAILRRLRENCEIIKF